MLLACLAGLLVACGPGNGSEQIKSEETHMSDTVSAMPQPEEMMPSADTLALSPQDLDKIYFCSNHNPQHSGTYQDLVNLEATYKCRGFH